jgi:Spy/CpxP family protein refolding chaperone
LVVGNLKRQGGKTSALFPRMVRGMNMKIKKILLLRIVFALISYLLIIFGSQPSKAQSPFYPQSKPMLRMDGQNGCWESTDLGLTEAQKEALEGLQRAYVLEALPLRIELISFRFELRHMIRDSNVQPKILLDRQKKISELQAKLDHLSLSYLIKARSIFTKEQWKQLPSDFSMGMELGSGIGVGLGTSPRGRFRR